MIKWVNAINALRSHYSTVAKAKAAVKGLKSSSGRPRLFDEHTVSIWAENMAKRGGKAEEAVNMVMNRMDSGKARHTTPLYNTALDICGHKGMMVEAAEIVQKMIAKNVRPNERTVTSLLNSIAEHAKTLPNQDPEVKTTNDGDEKDTLTGFPDIEAFNVKNKQKAARLAIQVYASWVEHDPSKLRVHPFNALLKVLNCSEAGNLLPKVFPLKTTSLSSSWVPRKLDQVSYSTAILAARSHPTQAFDLPRKYWQAFIASGIQIDSGIIMALLMSIHHELVLLARTGRQRLLKDELDARRLMLEEIHSRCQSVNLPVKTTNLLLEVTHRLGCFRMGSDFWHARCLPILEQFKSFSPQCQASIDQETIKLQMKMLHGLDKFEESITLFFDLQRRFNVPVSVSTFNLVLVACRRLNDPAQGDALFSRLVVKQRQIKPDTDTLYQMILLRKSIQPKERGARELRELISYFEGSHPQVYSFALEKNSIRRLLKIE